MAGINLKDNFEDEMLNRLYLQNTRMMLQLDEMRKELTTLKREVVRLKSLVQDIDDEAAVDHEILMELKGDLY